MNTKKALGWWLSISLVALAAPSIIGCGGVVTVGGGTGDDFAGDGGAGGDDGAGGGISDPDPTGGAGGGAPEAIAMTWAQLDAASNGGSGGSTSAVTAGGGPDPSTQFLMFGAGTETPACSAPHGSGQCGGWRASVTIPPYLFQPGILPFSDPDIDISYAESQDEGNGLCSGGGGGGFDEGQVEIVEITPTTVHFVVSGVTPVFGQDPNGDRVAARCP